MTYQEQEATYRKALLAMKRGLLAESSNMFRLLADESPFDPRFVSYRGLLMAICERQMSQGVALCKQAISLAPSEPEMHLNLVRIYKSTGRRESAVEALRAAIRKGVKHESVMREINALSPRSRPPLGSLDRNHALNKLLGKLQASLLGARRKVSPAPRARAAVAR